MGFRAVSDLPSGDLWGSHPPELWGLEGGAPMGTFCLTSQGYAQIDLPVLGVVGSPMVWQGMACMDQLLAYTSSVSLCLLSLKLIKS